MFEYKDAQFYNDYFNHLEDFKLAKSFTEEEKERQKYYIGEIEAMDSIHPLVLRAEIPVTFPHHHMMFYTQSLYGYPHLITCLDEINTSWFCLNTPFAETPEEQLNQEMTRLREWMHKVMRKDLPPRIEDADTRAALRKLYAYSWENQDEYAEYRNESNVTFIGDFAYQPEFFKEVQGEFYCVQSDSNHFYILEYAQQMTNAKLPYIIVDDIPNDMGDFVSLANQFNWSKETCDFLLPDFNAYPKEEEQADNFQQGYFVELKAKEEGRELSTDEYYDKFFRDPAFTEDEANYFLNIALETLIVPNYHKDIVNKTIESIKKEIKENHGIPRLKMSDERLADESDEDYELRMSELNLQIDSSQFVYPHYLNYFLLGIRFENSIVWKVCYTNRNSALYSRSKYDLGVKSFEIKNLDSWALCYASPKMVTEKNYFGRGKFEDLFVPKKIAIIGLGAVGSQLAISLARSGIKNFGLWDNDVIEPGNICRSSYTVHDLGNAKVNALKKQLLAINPSLTVNPNGSWSGPFRTKQPMTFRNGDLYGNINYKSQTDVISELKDYDVIIDCTASNELLHYLSYSVTDKLLISLCITNHAKNLLMVSNSDGNPFELRKMYLSKIEQDTKNFYAEGSGCFSPTFLALNCDIAALTNLAVKELNDTIGRELPLHSVTWSYDKRGTIADRLTYYQLKDNDIRLFISSEVMQDAIEMDDVTTGPLGYLFGGYSTDGKSIMITHCTSSSQANQLLADAYQTSHGIIDYIGDFNYAKNEKGDYDPLLLDLLADKASNENINTNNPLLAVRTPEDQIIFYLYINGKLVPFESAN